MISSTQLNGQQDILVYLGEDRIVGEDEPVLLTATVDLPGLGMLSPSAMSEGLTFTWFKRGFDEPEYPTEPFATSTTSNLIVEITDEPPGESTYYKVVVSDAIGIGCEDEVLVVVMKLNKILFHDSHTIYHDPGAPPFNEGATGTPGKYVEGSSLPDAFHWLKPSGGGIGISKPVCYTRNTPFQVSVLVILNGLENSSTDLLTSIKLKGNASALNSSASDYTYTADIAANTSPPTMFSPGRYLFPITSASAPFPNVINKFDLAINWQYDVGEGWKSLLTSTNNVYTTLNLPNMSQPGQYLFHTTLDIACTTAAGLSDMSAAVDAIYAKFATRNVQDLNGGVLKYWNNTDLSSHTTQQLLYNDDGKCGAFTRFFIDMIHAHGSENVSPITVQRVLTPVGSTAPTPLPDGTSTLINQAVTTFNALPNVTAIPTSFSIVPAAKFLVKNWNVSSNKFYHLLSENPENYQTTVPTYENAAIEGVEAQGHSNPYSLFHDHALVKFNNKYYDPSYGTGTFNSIGEWEASSIAAFGAYITHSTPTVYLLWIEKNNTDVATDVDLLEKIDNY